MKRRTGFTLVELLVVIGIIALLISILLPSLNKARVQANLTKCMSNLKTVGQSVMIYAANNKGAYPVGRHPDGGWLWDMPKSTMTLMTKNGAAESSFFCPMGRYTSQGEMRLNYGNREQAGWETDPSKSPGYAVIDYFFTMAREFRPTPGDPYFPIAGAPTTTVVDDARWFQFMKKAPIRNGGRLALGGDAVISKDNMDFISTRGGSPDTSNHMDFKKNIPSGGNILYVDGHVEWTPFGGVVQTAGSPPKYSDRLGTMKNRWKNVAGGDNVWWWW